MTSKSEYMRAWRANNRDKIKLYGERSRAKLCKEKSSAYQRSYKLRTQYGMTQQDYERMHSAQFGLCLICQRDGRLVVDHDHHTGEVRGLLCTPCNTAVGLLREEPDIIRRAAEYVEDGIYMATFEARGFVNKVTMKTSAAGANRCQFDLAVQQKVRKDGVDTKETLYVRCVDFKCEDLPVDGEYLGVTGYITLTTWSKNGKNGINADLTVKSYEKLPQKDGVQRKAAAPAADAAPPSDPFSLSPEKP